MGMRLNREPPVGGRDDPRSADSHVLLHKAALLRSIPHVIDHAVRDHQIERLIPEGERRPSAQTYLHGPRES